MIFSHVLYQLSYLGTRGRKTRKTNAHYNMRDSSGPKVVRRLSRVALALIVFQMASGPHRFAQSGEPEPAQRRRASMSTQREGLVRADGRMLVDDGGPFLALGATLFWALWGIEHDGERLAANLETVRRGGFDYIRALAVVGPGGWSDRTVDPRAANWAANVSALTDLAYDRYGVRVQWTIFGGLDNTRTAESRAAAVDRFLKAIDGRHHKVFAIEIANEGERNGFSGPAGWAELKALASRVREAYGGLLATTSPASLTCAAQSRLYAGAPASLLTLHFPRSDDGKNTWQLLEQVSRTAAAPCRGLPRAMSSNEPIGPYSSVREERDPARLVTSAAFTWMSGIGAYVLHTGAGIRGGGVEDRELGRPANLRDVDRWSGIADGLGCVRRVLPRDLPGWHHRVEGDRRHPFSIGGTSPRRTARGPHVAADEGKHFVMLLTDIREPVTLTARVPAAFYAVEPLHCAVVLEQTVVQGDAIAVPTGHDALIIIGERH
jgi:hypothetical protein